MDSDDLRIRRWGTIGTGYLGPAFHMRFKPGQVLYGSRRTYLRKVALAEFEGITANTTFVLEPKDPTVLLPDLLPLIMQTESFHEHSKEQSKGSVNPYINYSDLEWYRFPMPPMHEQRRFVRMVTAHLDLQESLRTAMERCKVVRKSLLEEFFPAPAGSPTAASLSDLVGNGDVELKTGPFGTVLSASEYQETGWPILNPTDMKGGEIAHAGGPCVDDETASRLQAYRLKPGDVLLARKGDFTKAVLAGVQHEGWIGGSDTIRLRVGTETLAARYLHLALQAPSAERMLLSYAHGTVMPGLNETVLGRLQIEMRPPAEQAEIIGLFDGIGGADRKMRLRDRALGDLIFSVLNHVLSGQDAEG